MLRATLGLVVAFCLTGCDKESAAPRVDPQAAAAPIILRLDSAIAAKDKFRAEDTLLELEKLIPADFRLAAWRAQVAALPGPKPQLAIDLGQRVTLDFILIRPGSFMMGSENGTTDEKPVHKVTFKQPFYLAKFLITQAQWQQVMGANPSQVKGPKLPVENVSWNDCQSFISKLQAKLPGRKFGLPTEAQWEYACRADSATEYASGETDRNAGAYAWYAGNAGGKTHPVGEKKPNAWGLHDMQGNVWQWCSDWYGVFYPDDDGIDPQGWPSGSVRVLRGGCWSSTPDLLRSACRRSREPETRSLYVGFRLLLGV